MGRFWPSFLGYRIYRRKFLGTAAVVLLLSAAVFSGMLVFFIHTWTTALEQQVQRRFLERERQILEIQDRALDYVNQLYGDAKLMEDLGALFSARDERRYLALRRENSLSSVAQIRYFPADVRTQLLDGRSRIVAVTLTSPNGRKMIRPQNGDVDLRFDFGKGPWLYGTEAGELSVASFSIRDPQHMGQTIGTMEFWVNSGDIYEKDSGFPASWGLYAANGELLCGSGLTGRENGRIKTALGETAEAGWFRDRGMPVFYRKLESGTNGYRYVAVRDVASLLWDNRYVPAALLAAFILFDVGVLVSSYFGIRSDATFLSLILSMLSDMEGGEFEKMRALALPVHHRENEYGMIAAALQDVGMKLKGYIETEYILKLKEQETQMRALQHQINPHFLYNTLETLRSKALTHGDRDMADAIAMLGSLYRSRMHKKESVLLKEEFELLEMYLKIMALRHGDKFVYQLELDPAILDMETVTFWLQPLAENFFIHGFDRESEYNLLIVSGQNRGDGALIEVSDNGAGADAGMLPEIRKNMYEGNDDPEADIGLRNVYMRLSYFYRDGFSMDVGNREEGGFFISVFLPYMGKRQEGKPQKTAERMKGADVYTGDRG